MKDILLNDQYEVQTANGDFKTGDSDNQHIALILATHAGEWKQFPITGVGLDDVANDERLNFWENKIATQLKADGLVVSRVKLTTDSLDVQAKYSS